MAARRAEGVVTIGGVGCEGVLAAAAARRWLPVASTMDVQMGLGDYCLTCLLFVVSRTTQPLLYLPTLRMLTALLNSIICYQK
jgi:hypothetical protein